MLVAHAWLCARVKRRSGNRAPSLDWLRSLREAACATTILLMMSTNNQLSCRSQASTKGFESKHSHSLAQSEGQLATLKHLPYTPCQHESILPVYVSSDCTGAAIGRVTKRAHRQPHRAGTREQRGPTESWPRSSARGRNWRARCGCACTARRAARPLARGQTCEGGPYDARVYHLSIHRQADAIDSVACGVGGQPVCDVVLACHAEVAFSTLAARHLHAHARCERVP
jgi:hypothetical protein